MSSCLNSVHISFMQSVLFIDPGRLCCMFLVYIITIIIVIVTTVTITTTVSNTGWTGKKRHHTLFCLQYKNSNFS